MEMLKVHDERYSQLNMLLLVVWGVSLKYVKKEISYTWIVQYICTSVSNIKTLLLGWGKQ